MKAARRWRAADLATISGDGQCEESLLGEGFSTQIPDLQDQMDQSKCGDSQRRLLPILIFEDYILGSVDGILESQIERLDSLLLTDRIALMEPEVATAITWSKHGQVRHFGGAQSKSHDDGVLNGYQKQPLKVSSCS